MQQVVLRSPGFTAAGGFCRRAHTASASSELGSTAFLEAWSKHDFP